MALAGTSDCRQRHGAAIVRGGSIISLGINRNRNHPLVLRDPEVMGTSASTHAEVVAIRQASASSLQGAVLYVARINKQGEPMMSRPCNRCYLKLIDAGIKEVVFTL